jgi:metal-sulfur cluster biosynthetic enzyme
VSGQLIARGLQALEQVMDPEFPISVVSMGLIRGLAVENGVAKVKLTFTSMGCPWTEWIERGIKEKLLAVEGIRAVELEIVWDKPWSRQDLAPDARVVLMKLGISP